MEQAENEMEAILCLAETPGTCLEKILFSRPREDDAEQEGQPQAVYISFFSPREGIPARAGAKHFRLPYGKAGIYHRMVAFLKVVEYELQGRRITVHFGWPMSSWWDRMAIGVMVFNLMKLPKLFPNFNFGIGYKRSPDPDRRGEWLAFLKLQIPCKVSVAQGPRASCRSYLHFRMRVQGEMQRFALQSPHSAWCTGTSVLAPCTPCGSASTARTRSP